MAKKRVMEHLVFNPDQRIHGLDQRMLTAVDN
jgi:hypothetical protein